jgi:hypothetical protein
MAVALPSCREKSTSLEQRRCRHFIEGLRAVANFQEQNAEAYYDGMHITMNRNVTVSRQFSEQITVAAFARMAVRSSAG